MQTSDATKPPATTALTSPPGGAGFGDGWNVHEVQGTPDGLVVLKLERADGAWVQVVVEPPGRPSLVRTPLGGVSYWGFQGIEEREAVKATRAFGALMGTPAFPLARIFPHLAVPPAPSGAQVRQLAAALGAEFARLGDGQPEDGTPRAEETVLFDPPGLGALLSPEITPDGPPVAGYVLRGIHLPGVGKRENADFSTYVLEFTDPSGGAVQRLRAKADRTAEVRRGVRDAITVSAVVSAGSDRVEGRLASLASWVQALLRMKCHEGLRIRVPERVEELRSLEHPHGASNGARLALVDGKESKDAGPTAQGPVSINLALDADCGQQCTFCSVKSYVTPHDDGDAGLDNALVQLRQARARGASEVRLNGIDPLAFSRVLDVVAATRSLGYRTLWVYSTARRFADAAFCAQLVDAAPEDLHITVPLYGTRAEVHEAVTGTPGSFDSVRAALANLQAALRRNGPPDQRRGALYLSTVVVRQNLDDFPALARFAVEQQLGLHVHPPYPMRSTTRDPYAASAVAEDVLVARLAEAARRMPDDAARAALLNAVGDLVPHPCVVFHHSKGTPGAMFDAYLEQGREIRLHGTEYRDDARIVHDGTSSGKSEGAFAAATVPCEHVRNCSLAPICPGEHYAAYASTFGTAAFAPVPPRSLLEAGRRYDPPRPRPAR